MDLQQKITMADAYGNRQEFSNTETFITFLENEIKFWSEQKKTFDTKNIYHTYLDPNWLENVTNSFKSIALELHKLNAAQQDNSIYNFQANQLGQASSNWLYSAAPFTPYFLEALNISLNTANSFLNSIKKSDSNFFSIAGNLLAYEYLYQEQNRFIKRSQSEKRSLTLLYDRLEKKTSEIVGDIDNFKFGINDWKNQFQASCDESIASFHQNSNQKIETNDSEFTEFMKNSKSNINEMEKTYKEKLRLEAPAQYWANKAKSYRNQGFWWVGSLGFFIVIGLALFSCFFVKLIGGKFTQSIESYIVFITIITIYAFLLKTLSKMTFSSFHLQRDAEEREQLAHVYLALVHDQKTIDEDSRKIVFQALFSRAETGLLGQDSSPAMPGGLSDIVKLHAK